MRFSKEEGQASSKMCGTLYDQTKSPSDNTIHRVNNGIMLNETPLSHNGCNNKATQDVGRNCVDHEVMITCYMDRSREEQLLVITTNNNNNNSPQKMDNTVGRKFNYSCPKVHSESQCQRTIEGYKMLQRPFDGEVIQHLWSKYQPPFGLKSSILNQWGMKLHFNLTFSVLLILLTVMSPCKSSPAHRVGGAVSRDGRDTGEDHTPQEFDRLDYLMQFGYLPQTYKTGALRTEGERDKSIEAFQKFANLPVTGKFDQATLNKMKQPRCGVPDIVAEKNRHHHHGSRTKRYMPGPSKWDQSDITYRILNYSPQLEQYQVTSGIKRAFKVWSRWVKLNFREVNSGHADIFIRFARGVHGDGYPFDGPGLILAHAFFPGDDQGGDMHFDEDEAWKTDSSGTNFFSVAVHEIGHSLGLAHSSVLGSLMYPWYQSYEPDFELHRDDIEGIQQLYEPRDGQNVPVDDPRDNPRYTVSPDAGRPTVHIGSRPDPTPMARPSPTPTPWGNQPPDPCSTTFDAITVYRNEIFMFKGRWFWRLEDHGIPEEYPVEIHRFFFGLPEDVEGFDAVYERPDDGRLVAFNGDRYWVFYGNYMDQNVPQEGFPITELGFPADVKKIDAAFIWGYNLKTYFISGNRYWKYFEDSRRMAHNYPRDMSIWDGVKLPVDAAFKDGNRTTFFFHKNNYYEFHDGRMAVRRGPKSLNRDWLGCKKPVIDEGHEEESTDKEGTADSSGMSHLFGHSYGTLHFFGMLVVTLFTRLLL